jgi:hypothetical protein
MGSQAIQQDIALVLCRIWRIPEGFATLVAGLFVVLAAIVAWMSVQRQIRSAEKIESNRRDMEITAVEAGFTAELMVYARGIIGATSIWNLRALHSPTETAITTWPVFQEPLYYKANISRIGLLRQGWVASGLIGFYANLLEINDQGRESLSGKRQVNVTNKNISQRLHIMASNMAQVLDGLNNDRKFPLQPEIVLHELFMIDGTSLSEAKSVPKDIQEVLLRLAGVPVPKSGVADERK